VIGQEWQRKITERATVTRCTVLFSNADVIPFYLLLNHDMCFVCKSLKNFPINEM